MSSKRRRSTVLPGEIRPQAGDASHLCGTGSRGLAESYLKQHPKGAAQRVQVPATVQVPLPRHERGNVWSSVTSVKPPARPPELATLEEFRATARRSGRLVSISTPAPVFPLASVGAAWADGSSRGRSSQHYGAKVSVTVTALNPATGSPVPHTAVVDVVGDRVESAGWRRDPIRAAGELAEVRAIRMAFPGLAGWVLGDEVADYELGQVG